MEVLDASGLNCPLPVLKTRKELNKLKSGDQLKVITTDPGSVKDMEAFCNHTSNKMVSTGEFGGKFEFIIEKE